MTEAILLMNDSSWRKRLQGFERLLQSEADPSEIAKESLKINSEFAIDRIKACKFVVFLVLNKKMTVSDLVSALREQHVAVKQSLLNTVRGYPMHGYALVLKELLNLKWQLSLDLSLIIDIIQVCQYYLINFNDAIDSILFNDATDSIFITDYKLSLKRKEFKTISLQEKIKNALWRSLTTCLRILEKIELVDVKQVVDLVVNVLLTVLHSGVIKEAQETLKILIKLENQVQIKDRINLFLLNIEKVLGQDRGCAYRRFDEKSDGIARVYLILIESVDSNQERFFYIKKIMEIFSQKSFYSDSTSGLGLGSSCNLGSGACDCQSCCFMELFQKKRNLCLQLLTFLVLHGRKDLPVLEILEFSLQTLQVYEEFKFSGTLYQLILRILGLYLKSTSAACICQTFLRLQVNQILKNHDQNQQLTIIFLQFISNMASHDCAFQDSFVEILNSRNYYLRRSARVIIAPTE